MKVSINEIKLNLCIVALLVITTVHMYQISGLRTSLIKRMGVCNAKVIVGNRKPFYNGYPVVRIKPSGDE